MISMLCLFQVTANGSRSVELKDGDYLIFNMETMPQSIKSFEKYNAGEDFRQHEAVFSLSFCPGDDKLLVGGEEGCYLFDSKGSKLLYRFTNERTRATAFSPDGMITAVGSTNKTYLYGTSGGELINTFDHGSPEMIEFSNDGTKMILSEDSAVYGYDVLNDEQFFQSRTENGFAHIGNDSKLIIPSGGNQVQVLQTGSLNVKELRHPENISFRLSQLLGWINSLYYMRGSYTHSSV